MKKLILLLAVLLPLCAFTLVGATGSHYDHEVKPCKPSETQELEFYPKHKKHCKEEQPVCEFNPQLKADDEDCVPPETPPAPEQPKEQPAPPVEVPQVVPTVAPVEIHAQTIVEAQGK